MFDFHHIGIGTKRFDAAIARYVSLGYELVVRVDDPGLNVRVAFLRGRQGPLIEILAPLGEDGPLAGLIARKVVPGPYHTCYAVRVLSEAADYLREQGFMPVSEATPALAFGGKPVQFFFERDLGLLELVESPPEFQTQYLSGSSQ